MDNQLFKLNDICKIFYSNNNDILLDIINKINIIIDDLNKQKDANEFKNLITLINKGISDNKINLEKIQKIIKELILIIKLLKQKYIMMELFMMVNIMENLRMN